MSDTLRFTFSALDADGDETDDTIEVELTKEQVGKPVSYFITGDEPLIANPDGTFTTLESAIPDPTQEQNHD